MAERFGDYPLAAGALLSLTTGPTPQNPLLGPSRAPVRAESRGGSSAGLSPPVGLQQQLQAQHLLYTISRSFSGHCSVPPGIRPWVRVTAIINGSEHHLNRPAEFLRGCLAPVEGRNPSLSSRPLSRWVPSTREPAARLPLPCSSPCAASSFCFSLMGFSVKQC